MVLQVYQRVAQDAVVSCLNGMNACVLAYGQTGSGKTHTVFGPSGAIEEWWRQCRIDPSISLPQAIPTPSAPADLSPSFGSASTAQRAKGQEARSPSVKGLAPATNLPVHQLESNQAPIASAANCATVLLSHLPPAILLSIPPATCNPAVDPTCPLDPTCAPCPRRTRRGLC
jgi:hypothetical protein